jgi:flagellar hook protein FlgE
MDALNIAASGLQAAQAQLNVTANNIANQNTSGYKAQRVDLAAAAGGGVDVEGVQSTGNAVDPVNEFVNLRQAALYYDANGMVIKAADQMYGSLLNILDTDDRTGDWDRPQELVTAS